VPQILNARDVGTGSTQTRIYVGRPTRWGNPYHIGWDGGRADVIAKYREWILRQPEMIAALDQLRGKDLVCWCAPEPCHADVLLELVNIDYT
jgi:Domain of unknown function (DUF4326)